MHRILTQLNCNQTRLILVTSIGIMTLGGCASSPQKTDPAFVAERWSETLAAFNIDAVFPPRYVQPGDIFLVMAPESEVEETHDRYKRRSVRLGRVDVRPLLKEDARKSLQLPDTNNMSPTISIFEDKETVVRLRPLAFNGFNVSMVKDTSAEISHPIKAFKTMLGWNSSDDLVMSISVPNAEHLQLPAIHAFDVLKEFCFDTAGKNAAEKAAAINRCDVENPAIDLAMESLRPSDSKEKMVASIAVITEVYYARQIDYYYGTRDGWGVFLNAAKETSTEKVTAAGAVAADGKPALPDAKQADKAVQNPPLQVVQSPGPPVATDPAAKTQVDSHSQNSVKLQAMQKKLDAIQTQLDGQSINGSLRVISMLDQGTLLQQTFPTPLAIGYRALWWKPNQTAK